MTHQTDSTNAKNHNKKMKIHPYQQQMNKARNAYQHLVGGTPKNYSLRNRAAVLSQNTSQDSLIGPISITDDSQNKKSKHARNSKSVYQTA